MPQVKTYIKSGSASKNKTTKRKKQNELQKNF